MGGEKDGQGVKSTVGCLPYVTHALPDNLSIPLALQCLDEMNNGQWRPDYICGVGVLYTSTSPAQS